MQFRVILSAVALAGVLVACESDDDLFGPTNGASVQYINASSTGDVSATNAGTNVGSTLAFQGSNASCVFVAPGTQTVGFSSGGTSVSSASTNFVAGQRYTVLLL